MLVPLITSSKNYQELYRTGYEIMSSRFPASPALAAASASHQVNLSDLGYFKSSLELFRTAAQDVTGSSLNLFAATSSDPTVLTATSANAGSYDIVVDALAQGQTLVSASQLSATAAIGTGATTTVSFEFGTTVGSVFTLNPDRPTESITIDSSNNSLQGIAAAVNDAQIGITAAVIFDGSDYTLTLTSPTGSANSLRISVVGDTALQDLLATDPAGVMNLTQTGAAQDASLSINGVGLTSSTNTVDGAIAETTLNLHSVGSVNLLVAADTEAIAAKVSSFVTAYNDLITTFKSFGASSNYNSNYFRNAQSRLATTLGSTPNGLSGISFNSLAQLGISTQSGGTLNVDTTRVKNAIALDHSAVTSLFTNGGIGIADKLIDVVDGIIGSGGTLAGRSASFAEITTSIDKANSRLSELQALSAQRLNNDYSRLGRALVSYQFISDLLTSQFSTH